MWWSNVISLWLYLVQEWPAAAARLLCLEPSHRRPTGLAHGVGRLAAAHCCLVILLTGLTIVSVCLSVYASRSQRRIANYERILAEGGQMGDAGRFEAPVPDEVPKIEMRKVGDARVSPLHYGDDAAEGV